MSTYFVRAHRYQIEALSSFVGASPNAPLAVRELAGGFNKVMADADAAPPVPPSSGAVYQAGDLAPDDWVYYVQTPAVEWRVADSQLKAQMIGAYQHGGTEYGYFLANFQRVRTTYAGILVQ